MGCGSSTSSVKPNVWADYTKGRVLGEGASCKVFEVTHKQTGQHLAMKEMAKFDPSTADRRDGGGDGGIAESTPLLYKNESDILRQLHHANIVEFSNAFETKSHFYIITVLCRGGELFDRVGHGGFTEKAAARLTRYMLEALAYCHSLDIVHRDLKPENFVFETEAKDSPMKLIDFGCALQVKDDEPVHDVTGSAYYVAPEVIGDYKRTGATWKASDMWSIGVMIYLLTHGYPPFNGKHQQKIMQRIRIGKFRFARDIKLSDGLKDIITKLLVKDPTKRLTAREALEHPWVKGDAASDEALPIEVLKNLAEFRAQCRLKKAVANLMRQTMSDADKQALDGLFNKFDKNGDGRLSADEIAEMLAYIGKPPNEAAELMKEMDEDHDGVVSRREFANMAVMTQLGKSERDIRKAWKMFDQDADGFVTVEEVEQLLGVGSAGAKQLIAEVDQNSDGKISFEEWLQAMKQADVGKITANMQQQQQHQLQP